MKKAFSLFWMLLAILIFAFAACNHSGTKNSAQSTKKLSIVTTIYPEYDWFKNILGNRADSVDLSLLIQNGVDLHSYSPSAEDILKIASADMVIYVGGESDKWIDKALKSSPKAGRIEINLLQALGDRVKNEEVVEGMQAEEEHESDEDEAEKDEHVWLSLKNAKVLVNRISIALKQLDSANAKEYSENTAAYILMIRGLDTDYQKAVDRAARKTVLFGDRFPFRYLVDDYGLKYYAAFVGCSAESEASFETIAFLAGKMDSESLPAIFTLEKGNGKIAHAILEASQNSQKAEILSMNSMQSITTEEIQNGADYLNLMRDNLNALEKALR